jgi:vancomycin permeability regulator SanA
MTKLKNNTVAVVLLFMAIVITLTFASFASIQREAGRVFSIDELKENSKTQNIKTGIVFGGGIENGEPRPILRDRLETAKKLLDENIVNFLIVSGDNRRLDYNEPQVMHDYLVNELSVDSSVIQKDFAGRSTYETCERANKIFGVSEAILVSETTHLPRAVYLCRHFNIDAYGAKSDGESSSGLRVGQRWREVLARNKAILNVYFVGEQTVLGEPIPIN